MATNRLKIAQPTGDPKTVAFTDDILLNRLTGIGLITVTGEGKEKTVSTDANKLTLDRGNNVKVVTPLVLDVKTSAPSTPTNALYAVTDGTENKLYWNGKLVDAHEPGTGYVTENTFNNTIGTWSTISGTVKKAIEDNKTAIANDLSEITAGTSGTGVTVTIGAKSNKSQTVAVSVQDGTTSQKGIVQLAAAHSDSDTSKAATGSTVADAITTFDANTIGSWTAGGKYTGTVKSAIESLAAVSMFKVVETLPQTGETNTIYIVKPAGKTEGPYEEYIWVDNKFEKIGDTDIQLQNYYKKSEVGEGFSESSTVKAYIQSQDTAVKNTADTASATSTDTRVSVSLTGTVGDHGLTVTTSDIASASALTNLTERVTTAEGEIDAVETKLAGITGTVKAYVDAETTRAEGIEGSLNTRLTAAEGDIDAIEGKLAGLPTDKTIEQAIEEAVAGEETRATGVEGTLTDLSTDVKTNLVAAINEVDAHADAAQADANTAQAAAEAAQTAANNAQSTANARLASITGNNGGGVSVQFTTDGNKAVTTAVSVTESTIDDTTKKFATTDKNVATGAKVQAAIDAAEQRAKTAQTYTADNVTIQVANNRFSAKTADVAQNGTALTTGGQVFTAINSAKTDLTGTATVTGGDITIKGAMHEAEAAQTTADNAQSAAQAAQSTADSALTKANSAVQTVEGDANINASKSGTNVTIGVKTGSNLAALLSHLSIVTEQ